MERNPAELLAAAEARAQSMREFEMATTRRLVLERVLTDHIIALGLASNAKEAGDVRIEDVLQAERERAGS